MPIMNPKLSKKNKNRKPRPKYKGGPEEIFEKFANSVVYIENKKDKDQALDL